MHTQSGSGMHMSAGGGVHMPGGMTGTPHVPGNMGGSPHAPGNLARSPHNPGAMPSEGHVQQARPGGRGPGGMQPGEEHGLAGHEPHAVPHRIDNAGGVRDLRDVRVHAAESRGEFREPGDANRQGRDVARTGEGFRREDAFPREEPHRRVPEMDIRHVAFQHDRMLVMARHDVRLGGAGHVNTRGFEAGLAMHVPPRAYLRAEKHRDLAHERAFIARHAADFHTRYVRAFTARELAAWRRGLWRNEWHYGRRGWWWEVDGVWYAYSEPVWPYPEQVADLTVYDTQVVDGPDLSAEEALPPDGAAQNGQTPGPDLQSDPGRHDPDAPTRTAVEVAAMPPPLPAAPPGWYHCDGPSGYYPGIPACQMQWQLTQTPPLPGEQ